MSAHLDLDALADAVAGESEPGAAAHLDSCADCRSAVAEVAAAGVLVTGRLAALPPVPVPDDVVRRLTTPPSGVTTLPAGPARRAARWQRLLPAAAGVVLLLAGGGYAVSRLGGSGGGDTAGSSAGTAATATRPAPTFPTSSTGTDYTGRADLARAVPTLLAGAAATTQLAPQRGAGTVDPLSRLRTPAGLADCLLALLPPDDPSVRPLALDYATFRGKPALVVLLPAVDAAKLDVYVVGPGCSRANDSTLFYTSVPRP